MGRGERRLRDDVGRCGARVLGEGRQHALGEKPVHLLVPLHLGERVGMGEPHERVLAGQGQKLSLEAQAVALGLGKRAPRGPGHGSFGGGLLLAGAAGHLQGRQALQHVGLLDAETAMGPQARPGAHGVVLRHQRVLDGGEHRQARVQRAIAAGRRVQVEAVEAPLEAELDERQRPFHHLLQGFRAFCLHELGRILVVRQGDGQELHGVAVLVGDALADEGQGAIGRLLARRVAVEQVDDLLGRVLGEHPDVPHGERRAQGGHHVGDPGLVQRDDVGVALHHDGAAGGGHASLRLIKPVEHLGLVEQRRFLGVQVLRLAGADDAAPEGHAVALGVEDGEHHALVEAVAHRAPAPIEGHVGADHLIGFEAQGRQVPHERAASRGVAEHPLLRHLAAEAAGGQILPRRVRPLAAAAHELGVVELGRARADLLHAALHRARHAPAPRVLRDVDVGAVGQIAHGLGKVEVLGLHDEREDVAPFPAAEAVPQLGGGVDLERGGLLLMQRAAAPEVAALLLDGGALADDRHEIARVANFLDILVADAGHAPPLSLRRFLESIAPRSQTDVPQATIAAKLTISESERAMAENNVPYLTLDPDVEEAIRADRAAGRTSPYRTDDDAVVRREDFAHDRATLTRPAFVRDIEKILNLPAYNRYADKTQVFSFAENDEISRRGLHVQLVSRVARGIGSLLGLNCDLIEAIALGHDTGHTPFGHAGERFLSACYHARTGRTFNHNVHSVRVLDNLYRRNISLQTLDGVLCHNGEFAQQVLRLGETATFEQLDNLVEACTADESTIKTLRPSTLEGCVVRVADMIAYIGKDRQDALAMGVIDSLSPFDSEAIGVTNAKIINNLTVDIVNNSYGKPEIAMSEEVFRDLKLAKKQNYEVIYLKEGMVDDTENLVEEMFEEMYARLLADLLEERRESPIFQHHVRRLAAASRSIVPAEYLAGEPDQIVVDYMASMTDSYFMAIYRHLFPESDRRIQTRGYCADL